MRALVLLALACALSGPALADDPAPSDAPQKRITAWPLVYHSADANEAETDILWPLLRYERKDTYERYAFRPFIFSTESDPAKDFRRTSVLWPLAIRTHEPERDWFHIFPVYWDIAAKDYSVWALWPLYGVYHRGADYTEHSTIWPLFTYGRDAAGREVRWSAPWPLIHYERRDATTSHRVLPLYMVERSPDASMGFVLPYFWSVDAASTTRGVFPLWYSRDTPDHDTTLVVPFYFGDRKPDRELRFITPLYADLRTPDTHFRTLFPLYAVYDTPTFGITVGLPVYARYTTPQSRFTTVLPVYFHSLNPERDAEFTYYFPVYGTYRRGDVVSSHYLFFPLYSRLEDRELQLQATDVIWPLFHYETSPDTLDVRALPLFWRSRTPEHAWTFSLLSGSMKSGDDERGWFVPFWYHSADADSSLQFGTLALLPPYYIDWKKPDLTSFHVWPFYGHDHEPTWDEYSTLWPLFRFGASPDGKDSLTQALVYYRKVRGDESSAGVLPFWYHDASPTQVTDLGLLLYWYRDEVPPQKTSWAFLWLYPPELSLVRYEHAPAYRRNALFPLYGYERDDAKDATKWSVLWPLFSYSAEGPVARESDVLWKVVTYERKDADTSDFRFLWRFVRSSHAKDSTIFEFNPFYYHETAEGKGDYWNVFGGLIGKRTGVDGKTEMQWLWFF